LLAEYGVTEGGIGAPIVSSMETVSLGRTPEGIEVFMDRAAWESGRVLVLNRVKPHTDFDGEVESGLMKMMAIGLGKLEGARTFHENSMSLGFDKAILAMGSDSASKAERVQKYGIRTSGRSGGIFAFVFLAGQGGKKGWSRPARREGGPNSPQAA